MQKISGTEIAQKIIDNLKSMPTPKKILASILVGKNPASVSFLKQKEEIAKGLGVDFRIYKFDENLKNDDLRFEVGRIANQKPVGGIIVQLPLPSHINRHYILNAIPREKDVDVLGERSLGAFYTERNPILPPAVGVVIEILKEPAALFEKSVSQAERARFPNGARESEAESKRKFLAGEFDSVFSKIKPLAIAVVGLGFLVGKPIAVWLIKKSQELYLLHRESNLSALKQVDLIITATGQAGLIRPEMLKDGAGIIDFGYSVIEMSNEQGVMSKKIRGDFDASLLNTHNSLLFYTSTPGGTGPILVAKIFENFYNLRLH